MPITAAPTEVLPEPALIIGEERVTSTGIEAFTHIYPAAGTPTATVPVAGQAEVDRAVQAARAAKKSWRAMPADARRRLILALADAVRRERASLARMVTVENGMPLWMGELSVDATVEMLEYNAGWADKINSETLSTYPSPALDYTIREPYGVVGVIVPWNAPLIVLGQTLGPALAVGNTIVVKPPENTPFTSQRVAELALEAGFPPGVINVVAGGAVAGEALVSHPDVDFIHFTGSGATARRILTSAQANLTPVGLELGGKSANIVFDDADLDQAAALASALSFQNTGQGCVNGTRVLVQRSVHDAFVGKLISTVTSLKTGDPMEAGTMFGPLVNGAQLERVQGFINRAIASGDGEIVTGGPARLGGDLADGFFLEPTVFTHVALDSELVREEIFGPVLNVIPFDDDEQAVDIANDSIFGLAGYIQTTNVARAHRTAAALETGTIWINGATGHHPGAPFGGYKQSGVGRLGGWYGIEEFSQVKNVWLAL